MNSIFNDPGFWHRLQFGFTIVYHYLFPQLTMGLAWFLVYWKWRALLTGDEKYNQAVRFGGSSVPDPFYSGGRQKMLHEINRRDVITNLLVWMSGILERSS